MDLFEELQRVPFFTKEEPTSGSQGIFLVMIEMVLALVGIVLNLTVLISIKEKETLLSQTHNVLIGNLCFANLVSAVFVKSIAVTYHGYAVATEKWDFQMAFCTVYTVTSRATWAVFPYTILALCWVSLLTRGERIIATWKESRHVKVIEFEDEDLDLIEEEQEGMNARQKVTVGFIWIFSMGYSFMSPQVLSKEREVFCTVRSELEEQFNVVSILAVIGIPFVMGPILCPVFHILLSICSCLTDVIRPRPPLPPGRAAAQAAATAAEEGEASDEEKAKEGSACLDCSIVVGFTLIFMVFYPTYMYVTEVYFGTVKDIFPYMFIKYVVGCLHLIACPTLVLFVKRDIRSAAKETYIKKSTQNDNAEITFEQLQENLGIGVQIEN